VRFEVQVRFASADCPTVIRSGDDLSNSSANIMGYILFQYFIKHFGCILCMYEMQPKNIFKDQRLETRARLWASPNAA
jgi:hypothetical protein